MGERPRLTEELEALRSSDEPTMARSGSELSEPEAEAETLRFLVDLFCQCTMGNPTDRPTAEHLYDILRARALSFSSSTTVEVLPDARVDIVTATVLMILKELQILIDYRYGFLASMDEVMEINVFGTCYEYCDFILFKFLDIFY
ncbi:hypothetical protein HHK36_032491 [Tetracentron sinense]|uniref:Uncharacterized protein n=1 Tax=Tetracentron sinense TaxID=13715 RepID=A0A835D0D8_TETSI|nr:hypothetical protein HHK36_032491 [Tetracentron sinense]